MGFKQKWKGLRSSDRARVTPDSLQQLGRLHPWRNECQHSLGGLTLQQTRCGPSLQAIEGLRSRRGDRSGGHGHFCEAGVGAFSEIFDADPDFAPRGAIARAWSMAELLRAYVEDLGPQPEGTYLTEGSEA